MILIKLLLNEKFATNINLVVREHVNDIHGHGGQIRGVHALRNGQTEN